MAAVEQRLRPVEHVGDPPTEEARTRLECLYRAHRERVHAICAAMLRDPQEAEDAAQQVFVSAFRALRGGSEPRDPGAWLATIARNESRARGRRQPIVPLQPELRDVAQEDPSTVVVRRSELASVWRAIQDLPASQRDALLLREVRGLSYHELVADLQLSHPSVRSLLGRARQTLRDQLRRGAAALTGAPWLNLFARLFGDGSSPALSSASRTAVVGLGALAITGGAVVMPSLHVPHRFPAHADAHRAVAATPPARGADSAAAPVVGERSRLQLRHERRSGGRGSSAGEDSGSGDAHRGGSDEHEGGRAGASSGGGTGSNSGGAPSVSSDGGPGSDSFSAAPRGGGETTATSGSPADGSTSGGDGGRTTAASGPTSDSASGGGSPDGSGGSGSDGGSGTSLSLSTSASDGGGSATTSGGGGSSGSSGSDRGSGSSGSSS